MKKGASFTRYFKRSRSSMSPIYTGRTTAMLHARGQCSFRDCPEFADHTHHITYHPEVTKPLCRPHHEEITILNGQQARKVRHELSNKHRWWIWYQWLEGKLRVRRTKKALEYIGEWDRRTTLQSDSRFATPDPAGQLRTEQAEIPVEPHTPKKKKRRRKKKTEASKSRRLRVAPTKKKRSQRVSR
jgi:hypothetical protein